MTYSAHQRTTGPLPCAATPSTSALLLVSMATLLEAQAPDVSAVNSSCSATRLYGCEHSLDVGLVLYSGHPPVFL
ncbi:hypothetical protein CSUI_004263 [Cystoisospora suis]|uniref:Uncharacterized protein n=1 Tax=Cystoisospora suis TaxID=483139 RepID=A0A2C6KZD8_9APIC|nr:hypothetical protein CSUI_004263 [Cystoisospora suis]